MNKIHIIGGTGKMGNWLKSFFESKGISVTVSGSSGIKNQDVETATIIIFTVPISKADQIIQKIAGKAKKDSLLIDCSSSVTKTAQVLEKIDNPSATLHLLFGPTVSTVQNQKIVVCPIKKSERLSFITSLFEESGARIFEMTIEDHEKQMAYLQGLIHFVNIALGKNLAENEIDLTTISTPVTLAQASALTRVLAQNPELLTEIQLSNPHIPEVIESFLSNSKQLLELIKTQNNSLLKKEIYSLNKSFTPQQTKKSIERSSKQDSLPKEHLKIGYLGPEGTYSHQATLKVTDKKYHTLMPFKTIYDIFKAVDQNTVDYAIVPAENSTEGTVRETLDFLVEFDLVSVGMVDLPIHHYLLSHGNDIKKIQKVISHPQAAGQVRNWLETNLPGVSIEYSDSTLAAVEREKSEWVAFVGPKAAVEKYNLKVLAENIEDNPDNITKFYIIAQKTRAIDKLSGKTLLFLTVFNRVGVLRDILQVIASFNINLTNIESRPSHEKVWDYYFFVELDIPTHDSKLAELLNVLRQYCPVIKVLGSV